MASNDLDPERLEDEVEWLLSDPRGRRFVRRVLDIAGFWSAAGDEFAQGRRSIACDMIAGFSPIRPLLVGALFDDHFRAIDDERQRAANERAGDNRDGDGDDWPA